MKNTRVAYSALAILLGIISFGVPVLAYDQTCDKWTVTGAGTSGANGTYSYNATLTTNNNAIFGNSYLAYSGGTSNAYALTITAYGRELHPNPEGVLAFYYASVSGFQGGDFSGIDTDNANGTYPPPTITYDGSGCGGGGGGSAIITPPYATSTIEQIQQNTNWGFGLFLASAWFIMWIFKRR